MDTIGYILLPSVLVILVMGLILLIGSSFVYWGLTAMTKRFNRCPSCGKNDAGTIVETITLETNTHMDYKYKPPRRVIEKTLEDHYQCDFCDHTWNRTINEVKKMRVKL
ncbi:MAG: hypothetical protein AAF629_34620 [Chloroflexota bacterium]